MKTCSECGRKIKRKYAHGLCILCYNFQKRERKELRQLRKTLRHAKGEHPLLTLLESKF